jgi:hypothetical protein
VPLRNRVTPFGEIVAVSARGTLMGNRGILHDAERRIVRDSQVKRWITCRLEFRGRHREVMRPGSYTELFFLDEATALAAGHRPCAECRHADYRTFQAIWRSAVDGDASAESIDARLHRERRERLWVKRTYRADVQSLPDGAFISVDGRAWMVHGTSLVEWTAEGYRERTELRATLAQRLVTVLTPPSLVAVLRAGYPVFVHSAC